MFDIISIGEGGETGGGTGTCSKPCTTTLKCLQPSLHEGCLGLHSNTHQPTSLLSFSVSREMMWKEQKQRLADPNRQVGIGSAGNDLNHLWKMSPHIMLFATTHYKGITLIPLLILLTAVYTIHIHQSSTHLEHLKLIWVPYIITN